MVTQRENPGVTTRLAGRGAGATGHEVSLVSVAAILSLVWSACLSTPANDYLYSCANGQGCPTGAGCAGDQLCHPLYAADAGPADAGAYLCASSSPECPDGQTCGKDGLCSAPDAGGVGMPDAGDAGMPDAGDAGDAGPGDAGPKPCDLASAFPGSSAYSCGTDCSGLAVGDFNRDGYADVVVAVDPDNSNKGGLALLLNDGTGSFGAPTLTRTLYTCDPDFDEYATPDAFAVADFNGDGWPDLGLSISSSGQLALAINDQSGGFTVGSFQPGSINPDNCNNSGGYSAITAYQASGSWYLAALGYNFNDGSGDSVTVVSQVQGNATGLGSFDVLEPAQGYVPFGLTAGLFAADPIPSVAISEESLNTGLGQIELYSGTQKGTQAGLSSNSSQTLICQAGTDQITSADLNGDGLPDLVTVNSSENTVEIFYAKDGGFRPGVSFDVSFPTFPSNDPDAGAEPGSLAIADLDGDGHPDIATVNFTGSISILKGLSDGGFLVVAMQQTTSDRPYWISAVDLADHGVNDGGLPDLVVGYLSGAGASAIDVYRNACH